jgi:hypothetical protein
MPLYGILKILEGGDFTQGKKKAQPSQVELFLNSLPCEGTDLDR